ncbi:MAG: ATP-binding protein [Candidatus Peregrinibacteria bacterium]|nr:ATP-binding protein [Candidatus Peregrinibacteria bacterium]
MEQPQASQPDNKPVKITITLPTNAYFLSGIRDFTLTMTKNMTGFSDQWAFRFQSVVDELCNNAIEHGSAPGKEIIISFIGRSQESLEIVVEDTGTGPNKYTAAEMRELLKQQMEKVQTQFLGLRGRGLAKIVSEWTDELVFEDCEGGGLRVRVKKYIRNEDSQPAPVASSQPASVMIPSTPSQIAS